MSWTNETVLEFLELYKQEQLLWDPKHPLHRNRCEVSEAWNRIQTSLSTSIYCSITVLKKKKESLMTSFRMHLSKKKLREGYRTNWFAYPLMESFLSGKYECDSTNQLDNEFFTNNDHYSSQAEILDHSNNINRSHNSDKSTIRQNKPMKTFKTLYVKKRMDETDPFSSLDDSKAEKDEYDLYGQLLAKKLRKLDEHQRDLAMHEIDNVMFRAKMQSAPTQARSYSTSPSPVPRKMKSPIFIVAQHGISNLQYEDENIQSQEQAPS